MALYKGLLIMWLGSTGVPPELSPLRVPLQGIAVYWPWQTAQREAVLTVIAPALICAAMGVWALWKRAWPVARTNPCATVAPDDGSGLCS